MIELDTSSIVREPELHNFFVDCPSCGYDSMRFDFYDQVRVCPHCGRETALSPEYQEFLRREKQETEQWLKETREKIRQVGEDDQ